eukprot:scaffold77519_cov66-Attheya_sp.AAC.2
MAQVLVEHEQFDLPSFAKTTARKGWDRAKEIAYSKRWHLYARIVKRHGVLARGEGRNRMRDSALGFDQERGSLTVLGFYNKLKAADNTVKKRKPRVVAAVDGSEDSDEDEVVVPAIETAAAKTRRRLNMERGVEDEARRQTELAVATAAAQQQATETVRIVCHPERTNGETDRIMGTWPAARSLGGALSHGALTLAASLLEWSPALPTQAAIRRELGGDSFVF